MPLKVVQIVRIQCQAAAIRQTHNITKNTSITQNKQKELKLGLVTSYDIRSGNEEGPF